MAQRRSRVGLDEDHSVWHKLYLFVVTAFLGPLTGLVLFAGISVLQPPWQSLAMLVAEVFAGFWIAALIFIWWRPPWFRRIYLRLENKLILTMWVIVVGAILVVVFELA